MKHAANARHFLAALLIAVPCLGAVAQRQPVANIRPDQAAVASKTAHFGSIAAKSAAVKKALKATDLAGAMKLVGKVGSFTGTVAEVYAVRGNGSMYLNFAKPWDKTISGQVLAADYAKLPPLKPLSGKRVLISGTFSAYRGTHPQIVVHSAGQIRIVK